MAAIDLLITGAKQLLHFLPEENGKWRFDAIPDGSIAIADGRVVQIGAEAEVLSEVEIGFETRQLDATGKVITPGLVDSHTHPVFFQTRENEFEMRVQGKSYEEIAVTGGGIRSSVRGVREASKEKLKDVVSRRLERFLALGTTTIEAKSGYGLSLDAEVKSLEVIRELNEEQALEMIPTFLGAHEVPTEYRENRDEYINLVTDEMIPHVAENGLAEFCDIFCEEGVYSVFESRRILGAAKEAGLKIKLHADQLHLTGATRLAIELGAVSADHLECLDEQGVHAIAASETIAALLPGAVFFLGSHRYPPGRRLLDSGARVCLATDFNPGSSMTQSLPLMMTLGCLFMQMTPEEVIMASTIYGAASICREDRVGNLEPGYQADLVIWDADDFRQIPYYYGVNLVDTVIKKGQVVFKKN